MATRIATITVKTPRVREVARFWRDLLGYEIAPNHTDSVMLVGDGPTLLIQPSDDLQEPGATHLDLRPDDQLACVAEAVALGATRADIGQTGAEGWIVLADPGGNLFCVLAAHADSAPKHPATITPVD
jgi:hypothetical protein